MEGQHGGARASVLTEQLFCQSLAHEHGRAEHQNLQGEGKGKRWTWGGGGGWYEMRGGEGRRTRETEADTSVNSGRARESRTDKGLAVGQG